MADGRWPIADKNSREPRVASQLLGDLFHGVTLDVIAGLEIGETFDSDAAFHAGADFIDFILKPAQRLGEAFVNDFLASAHAHFAFHYAPAGDHATGDGR